MKTGNEQRTAILTARDRTLLAEVAHMRVVTSRQAARLAGFHSKTRANARLLRLTQAGYLTRSFFGTISGGRAAAYRVRNRPRHDVLRPGQLEHQLAIAEVYTRLREAEHEGARLSRFELRSLLPSSLSPIIPDAYLELSAAPGVRASFLEVDLGTEALSVWRAKAERYLELARSGAVERHLGHAQFRVLVVAHSARRADSIRAEVSTLTDKIFWFADLPSIQDAGIFSPVWLRPTGEERLPLI